MHGAQADQEAIAHANELYWSSEFSVNQIAEQMDLSKGAFYSLIRPLPAGLGCPECGTEVGYGNRTSKDRGLLACSECGWEGPGDDAESYGGDASVTLPAPQEPDVEQPPTVSGNGSRNRILIGGALLGAATGLALVFWARRR